MAAKAPSQELDEAEIKKEENVQFNAAEKLSRDFDLNTYCSTLNTWMLSC
jgi:hypothetical protein